MVVDASVWVSSLVREDLHYDVSRDWIGRELRRGTTFAIPVLALAEIGGAISRRQASSALGRMAVESVLSTIGLHIVPLDLTIGHEAARIAADYALRGADATYAAVARVLGLPLYTWDAEMMQRAGTLIRVATPSSPL